MDAYLEIRITPRRRSNLAESIGHAILGFVRDELVNLTNLVCTKLLRSKLESHDLPALAYTTDGHNNFVRYGFAKIPRVITSCDIGEQFGIKWYAFYVERKHNADYDRSRSDNNPMHAKPRIARVF